MGAGERLPMADDAGRRVIADAEVHDVAHAFGGPNPRLRDRCCRTEAKPRAQIHWQLRYVFAAQMHPPGFRRLESNHDIKRRRLAGAVGAQQPDNFSRLDMQRDIINDPPPSI